MEEKTQMYGTESSELYGQFLMSVVTSIDADAESSRTRPWFGVRTALEMPEHLSYYRKYARQDYQYCRDHATTRLWHHILIAGS